MRIPVTSKASFEEVLGDEEYSPGQLVSMEQLARLLHGSTNKVLVHLVQPSDDVVVRSSDDDVDLPREVDITLTAVVDEQCVLASVDSASRPAFHLPLRTDIDVRVVKYLDRADSPFLTGDQTQRRRLSTTDRCVEALYTDALCAFMAASRHDLTSHGKRSVRHASTPRPDNYTK